jgi:3-oxoacyl-[acyl-carrier protein] reductase
MEMGIRGKSALVTGASRGLGRAIATRLAAEGVHLILVARNSEALATTAAELAPLTEVATCAVDLLEEVDSLEATLGKLIFDRYGFPEIVVHNLGGSLGVKDPLAPVADWRRVWDVNVGVGVEINRLVIPHMRARGWGRIVHISSSATYTYGGYPAYTAAKSALNSYVTRVSREVANDGVIISAVSPGALNIQGRFLSELRDTDPDGWREYCRNHLAVGRLGEPDEVASAVTYLCSQHGSFAVGAILNLDGGSK